MVFGFLDRLLGPDAGLKAVQASYDKHYRLGERHGIEPVSTGLYGALASRYKMRRKFISEPIHMVEIAPFALMGEAVRVERLANYLFLDEIPDRIDLPSVQSSINNAISTGQRGNPPFDLIAAYVQELPVLPIRWVDWLNDANKQKLIEAYLETAAETDKPGR